MADFVVANYEMDDGSFRPIKVLTTTIIADVNPNADTAGVGAYVRAGGKRRTYGTVAREVVISRQIGTADPYTSASVSVTIPILTKAAFEALNVGAAFEYNSVDDFVITGKRPESTR
jgi:hypothetical protein